MLRNRSAAVLAVSCAFALSTPAFAGVNTSIQAPLNPQVTTAAVTGDVDEVPYKNKHPETNYASWQIVEGATTFKCIDPHAACSESEQVLETLKAYIKAASRADFVTCAKYLDDGCTTFDSATKELIVGKQAVLDELKKRLILYSSKDDPLVLYTIEHPYAKVTHSPTGDMAVVTFCATKKFGGKEPKAFQSRCTDIWVKADGMWKKVHFRSDWKQV